MAKYVIEDTTLTNTANAIREKTGGTEPITPSNFATEIAGIQSGGDTTQEDGIVSKTLTSYSNDRVTAIGSHVFYGAPIKSIDCQNVENIGSNGFAYTNLTDAKFPSVTEIGAYAFSNCTTLENVYIPSIKTINVQAFYRNYKLKKIDLHAIENIKNSVFDSCSILDTLIIRGETLCNLQSSGAFISTPINSGTGYIYVPDALVDSYKSATNWSAFANQIKPISELEASE